ncbi:hypothetical protein E2P81_ATG04586 [Venturia nashicola]|nr:hypothetical protein E2P81_ATG04586 [Venturia nashicola]
MAPPRAGPPLARKATIKTQEVEEDDTLVHKAFREQKAPDATFRFPHGFDAFKTAWDAEKFDAISKASGCKLTPEAVGDTMGVKLYGNRSQCADAASQLRAWSFARDKAVRKKTFGLPNVHSYNPTKDDSTLRKAATIDRGKKFLGDPDAMALEGKKFKYAITLEYKLCEWMVDDKILGVYMEALDPIRIESQCHIVYMNKLPIPDTENGDKNGFRLGEGFFLCGNDRQLIDLAVQRLMNVDMQINARKIDAPQLFLVKPLTLPLNRNAHAIERKKYLRPQLFGHKVYSDIDEKNFQSMHLRDVSGNRSDSISIQKANVRSIKDLDTGAILMGSRHTTSLNIQYIDMWLTAMLERLHCWKGYLEMRVSVGTCAFKTFPTAQRYSLDEFEHMVEERNSDAASNGLEAYMTTELGDCQTESALLERFLGSGHNLISQDHVPDCAVFPKCTAIFNMKSPWNPADILRLRAVFKENGFGEFLLANHHWEVLEGDKDDAKQMIDIKLVDLKHSHTSNGISVVAGTFVTEAQKAKFPGWSLYDRFLKKISVISENAKSNVKDGLLFDFEESNGRGGVHLLSLEQRKSYFFEIAKGPGGGYHVELFSFQMPGLRNNTLFPQNEQRWGVQLWHPSWDTLFYDQQHLKIGMRANWEPAEWQFFPPAGKHIHDWQDVEGTEFEVGSGYRNMLDAVNVVEKIILGDVTPDPPVATEQPETEKKTRQPKQRRHVARSIAETRAIPTGNIFDLVGLEIAPVDRSTLTGAALDLADVFM